MRVVTFCCLFIGVCFGQSVVQRSLPPTPDMIAPTFSAYNYDEAFPLPAGEDSQENTTASGEGSQEVIVVDENGTDVGSSEENVTVIPDEGSEGNVTFIPEEGSEENVTFIPEEGSEENVTIPEIPEESTENSTLLPVEEENNTLPTDFYGYDSMENTTGSQEDSTEDNITSSLEEAETNLTNPEDNAVPEDNVTAPTPDFYGYDSMENTTDEIPVSSEETTSSNESPVETQNSSTSQTQTTTTQTTTQTRTGGGFRRLLQRIFRQQAENTMQNESNSAESSLEQSLEQSIEGSIENSLEQSVNDTGSIEDSFEQSLNDTGSIENSLEQNLNDTGSEEQSQESMEQSSEQSGESQEASVEATEQPTISSSAPTSASKAPTSSSQAPTSSSKTSTKTSGSSQNAPSMQPTVASRGSPSFASRAGGRKLFGSPAPSLSDILGKGPLRCDKARCPTGYVCEDLDNDCASADCNTYRCFLTVTLSKDHKTPEPPLDPVFY